jgi:arginine/lysine/ornithine decarboxylase
MASLDLARYYLNSYTRDDSSYLLDKIKDFINSINQLQFIKAVNGVSLKEDPIKITIQSSRGLTGFQVQKALEKFHVYPEMADIYNVLLMFPLLKKGMEYPQQEVLYRLKAADKLLGDIMPKPSEKLFNFQPPSAVSTTLYSYKELRNLKEESVPLRLAKGLIASESIIPYPPGIPLLLKGEIISESHIEMLEKLIGAGASFHGGSLLKENKIIAGRA